MAVPVGTPQYAHPLVGQIGRHDARKMQRQNHRHGRAAAVQIGFERAAQRHIFGSHHGHHNADPPDVLAVEIGPPGDKIERSGHPQLPPGIAGAQKNLEPEAQKGRPFQNRTEDALHPGPVFPGHAVAEHHRYLIGGQPRRKGRSAGAGAPAAAPAAEKQVLLLPQRFQGRRQRAFLPQHSGQIHHRRGKQCQ